MKIAKYCLYLLIPATVMVSCKKSDFVAINVNSATLPSIDPGDQFLTAASHLASDFEYYYDVYRDISPWMQYMTSSLGNGPSFTSPGGNFNYRYSNFYSNIGIPLADIPHLISKMTDSSARVYENDIATIYKAYYAFYVSDINGSIPYSQAFQGRYGGTLTPEYDTQASLFDTLDAQIKGAVSSLETAQPVNQTSYAGKDPFYAGDPVKWTKAGNALRLKIAMRLMKRSPEKLQAIATEVLADATQMASNDDGWVLLVGPSFAAATGNFNPTGLLAAQPVVDFMLAKGDPRLKMFYRPNSSGLYVGSPTSPDVAASPTYQAIYQQKDTPLSPIQHRLFPPNFNENDGFGVGSGIGFFPVITYAEYCFMRAELGARTITGDDASTWYNNGVTASINFYNTRAIAAGITGYVPITGTDIPTYLGVSGVAFDPTRAVEQIVCQAYLDFYRQPSEAWAWYKRTGFPNTSSVLAWSALTSNGNTLPLARRAPLSTFSTADANYANQQAAYQAMAADPGFGTGAGDAFGRVWWDQ